MKDSLSRIVANRYGGRNIPVALVLPDGGRVALSEAPEVDIYARTWNGLERWHRPSSAGSRVPTFATTWISPAVRSACSTSPRRWSAA